VSDWIEDLPVKLGPASNGEYDPVPHSPVVREALRRARELVDRGVRRTGVSRREFLRSLPAAAAVLFALDACTREAVRHGGRREDPGGRYDIAPEAVEDEDAAREALAGEEFVFDVQGHLLEYELNPAAHGDDFWTHFPQQDCGEDDPRECFSIDHFLTEFFLRSDTNLVALSALPIWPDASPLSLAVMEETRRVAEALCGDDRVLVHGQALPNLGSPGANLEAMEGLVQRHRISAWKTFTHFPDGFGTPGTGWWLDDHEPGVPQVGERFIARAVRLGVPIVCAHKGLSGGSRFASPEDIGPAARKHPEARFVVYHSGYESTHVEGPYTRATAHLGINRLITSMRRAGIGPGQNVYAEIGSTWWNVLRDPTQAAHVLGKLLRYVGEDNVLWGTDSIFYGSPQDRIQALRAFRITERFQERYGYPRLTGERKAKILGLNAARLYGVDPAAVPCEFSRRELERVRKGLPIRQRTLGPRTPGEVRAFREHHQGWP
jgi:uncharacterized protein